METKIPASKWRRSLESGKTAAKVGGKVLQYLARKPFLTPEGKQRAKSDLDRESADLIFKGLTLLRGTALKIAQQLSVEIDIFPEEICKELEKSYHQVPPLNRALIRKVVMNALDRPPEQVFQSFDYQAFAAASLGQVHRAVGRDGSSLAVKVQYPGIDATITSDIQMLKTLFRTHPDADLILPMLDEIEARLVEEVDYRKEARNLIRFKAAMSSDRVHIPEVLTGQSNKIVLTETFVEGLPLDQWLKTGPSQEARDAIARTLHHIFFTGLYEMNCIHADPNPGNYIIRKNGELGLIDFGCVKQFDPEFVSLYRQLPKTVIDGDKERYFRLLENLKIIDPDLDEEIKERLYGTMNKFRDWFGRLFENEFFDFGENDRFFSQGRALMNEVYKLRKHMDSNPEFVFLDRTRYGLLRLFEKMGARVKMRNSYEFG